MQKRTGRWRNKIRLTMFNGKIYHSGLKIPLKIVKEEAGVRIGCTHVSNEVLSFFKRLLEEGP